MAAGHKPDNLKSAVARSCRYDPDLNPTYREFARHYQIAIVPARVARPRDKAKVEAGVLLVERWILARLRHGCFFSLTQLNDAIRALLVELSFASFFKRSNSALFCSNFSTNLPVIEQGMPLVATIGTFFAAVESIVVVAALSCFVAAGLQLKTKKIKTIKDVNFILMNFLFEK